MREGNGPHRGLASLVGRAAPRHQAQHRHRFSPDERLRERPGPHQSRASFRGRAAPRHQVHLRHILNLDTLHTYTHIVLLLSQDRQILSIFCVSKKVMGKVCAYRCLCVRAVSAFFTLQKLHTYTPTHIPHLHIHTYLCPKTRWLK